MTRLCEDNSLNDIVKGDLFSPYFLAESLPQSTFWNNNLDQAGIAKNSILEILKEFGVFQKAFNFTNSDLLGFISSIYNVETLDKTSLITKITNFTKNAHFKGLEYYSDLDSGKDIIFGIINSSKCDFDKYSITFRDTMRVNSYTCGILTNGYIWRLYFKTSSYSFKQYYEVNLNKLITSDLDFRYFLFFFTKKAFILSTDDEIPILSLYETNQQFLLDFSDEFFTSSYSALLLIMVGFFNYSNNLFTPEDLEDIYQTSLLLLFRLYTLLFINQQILVSLYTNNEKKVVVNDKNLQSTGIYQELNNLFKQGPLNNFLQNDRTNFFEKYSISDYYILQTIIKLIHRNKTILNVDFLSIQHLGALYEKFLEYKVKYNQKDGIYLENTLKKRKQTGSYFTPNKIIRSIVKQTLDPLINLKVLSSKLTNIAQEIYSLKIIDPAMGSGLFLIETVYFLTTKYLELTNEDISSIDLIEINRSILNQCIYGMDKDYLIAEIAKISLLITFGLINSQDCKLADHIKVGNSLYGTDRFPDTFLNHKLKFSAIISNPPWGEEVIQKNKEEYSRLFGVKKRNLNAFDLFLRQAISSSSSMIGFLLPRNFINRNDYSSLRKFVIENSHILQLQDWKLFPGVIQECVSLILSKNPKMKPDNIIVNKTPLFSQEAIVSPLYIFNIYSSKEEIELKEKIKSNGKSGLLDSIIEIKRGEEIAKNSEIIQCPNPQCSKWRTQSSEHLDDDLICSQCHQSNPKYQWLIQNMLSSVDDPGAVPIVTGSDLSDYYLYPKIYMNFNWDGIQTKSGMGIYKKNKILLKKISQTLTATFDPSPAFYTQNVYGIRLKPSTNYSFFFLLAIFNSFTLRFFYEHEINLGADITTAVSIKNIRNTLPIPNIGESDKRATLINSDNIHLWLDDFSLFKNADSTNFLNQKDLYLMVSYFAEKLVSLNNTLIVERKDFLSWIERILNSKIESFEGKTYIMNYWEGEFQRFSEILKKNRNKYSLKEKYENFNRSIHKRFVDSLKVNKSLDRNIQHLRNIIEALIFHLYNLSLSDTQLILKEFGEDNNQHILEFYKQIDNMIKLE